MWRINRKPYFIAELVDKSEGTIKYDYSEKFFEEQITFWNVGRKERGYK